MNSVSPLRLGKIDRAGRDLGGATLLFRWEAGVLASGLVCGMIEFAGAQAGRGEGTGQLSRSDDADLVEMFYPVPCLRQSPGTRTPWHPGPGCSSAQEGVSQMRARSPLVLGSSSHSSVKQGRDD